jgi:uncharacterized surface protein with fasciclin (FAS1) repeats
VIGADVYEFFLKKLITDVGLGQRVDTDFVILTVDGFSIWTHDGTSSAHWLYEQSQEMAVAKNIGLTDGWFALASVALEQIHEPPAADATIVDKLYDPPVDPETGQKIATFGIFIQLLRMTGLLEILRSVGPYTVLAPTDAAFAKLSEGQARDLLRFEHRKKLASILEYHIYPDKFTLSQLSNEATVQGESIVWDKTKNPMTANEADVLFVDLAANNGIIHVLDHVLTPKDTNVSGVSALVELIDFTDIDYTTWRIRQASTSFNDKRTSGVMDAQTRLEEALDELVGTRSKSRQMSNKVLSKTKTYDAIATIPSRKTEALLLNEQISVENDKLDITAMKENEIDDIRSRLDEIAAEIRALAIMLRQTANASEQ